MSYLRPPVRYHVLARLLNGVRVFDVIDSWNANAPWHPEAYERRYDTHAGAESDAEARNRREAAFPGRDWRRYGASPVAGARLMRTREAAADDAVDQYMDRYRRSLDSRSADLPAAGNDRRLGVRRALDKVGC